MLFRTLLAPVIALSIAFQVPNLSYAQAGCRELYTEESRFREWVERQVERVESRPLLRRALMAVPVLPLVKTMLDRNRRFFVFIESPALGLISTPLGTAIARYYTGAEPMGEGFVRNTGESYLGYQGTNLVRNPVAIDPKLSGGQKLRLNYYYTVASYGTVTLADKLWEIFVPVLKSGSLSTALQTAQPELVAYTVATATTTATWPLFSQFMSNVVWAPMLFGRFPSQTFRGELQGGERSREALETAELARISEVEARLDEMGEQWSRERGLPSAYERGFEDAGRELSDVLHSVLDSPTGDLARLGSALVQVRPGVWVSSLHSRWARNLAVRLGSEHLLPGLSNVMVPGKFPETPRQRVNEDLRRVRELEDTLREERTRLRTAEASTRVRTWREVLSQWKETFPIAFERALNSIWLCMTAFKLPDVQGLKNLIHGSFLEGPRSAQYAEAQELQKKVQELLVQNKDARGELTRAKKNLRAALWNLRWIEWFRRGLENGDRVPGWRRFEFWAKKAGVTTLISIGMISLFFGYRGSVSGLNEKDSNGVLFQYLQEELKALESIDSPSKIFIEHSRAELENMTNGIRQIELPEFDQNDLTR